MGLRSVNENSIADESRVSRGGGKALALPFFTLKTEEHGLPCGTGPAFLSTAMDFSHVDHQSKPTMVDVSAKGTTERIATAECFVNLGSEIMRALSANDWASRKGPILDTAIIAGTMAAKKTSDLIPFCHPLNLKSVKINIAPVDDARLRIEARVKVLDQTGVEMEALTAVSVAGLTIYDMCKAASKGIVIEGTRLVEKTGGKSDYKQDDPKA
jgi:cyclic pyranopterin phosphate synthase